MNGKEFLKGNTEWCPPSWSWYPRLSPDLGLVFFYKTLPSLLKKLWHQFLTSLKIYDYFSRIYELWKKLCKIGFSEPILHHLGLAILVAVLEYLNFNRSCIVIWIFNGFFLPISIVICFPTSNFSFSYSKFEYFCLIVLTI